MAYEKALAAATREANPTAPPSSPARELYPHYRKGAKMDYVRGLIAKHPSGLEPNEIRKRAREDGITVNVAYPYSILIVLKRKGEIRESGGKYSPAKKAKSHDVKNQRTTNETETVER